MNENELQRYSRSIIMQNIGIEGQLNLKNSKIFVFGCGGIASGLLPSLASAGIGTICICDFDVVDLSNIQRQTLYKTSNVGESKVDASAKLLNEINPLVSITTYNLILNDENYDDIKSKIVGADIIIDTTDNFSTRSLINRLAIELEIPLFSSSCIELTMQMYFLHPSKPNFACYNCIFSNVDDQKTCANSGVMPSTPIVAGSCLANFVLQYIINPLQFSLMSHLLTLNLASFKSKTIKLTKDAECNICNVNLYK